MQNTPEAQSVATLDKVLEVIRNTGSLKALAPTQDFYDAGLTSVASLTLLLDLEEKFNISIPDDRFIECRTAEAVSNLIGELQA